MKKKYIITGIIVLLIAIISIYLLICPRALGNMKHSYSQQTTATSNISFAGKEGDRIKFSFTSDIRNGDLDITVYDSKRNVVKELDRAKRLETFLILDYTDTYTLMAEYKDFIGSFNITIYKVD